MKKYLLIIITISFVFGQETDFDVLYNDNTIYLKNGFFGPQYIKGGESFSLASLGSELNRYPEASDLYEKSFMMRMLGFEYCND